MTVVPQMSDPMRDNCFVAGLLPWIPPSQNPHRVGGQAVEDSGTLNWGSPGQASSGAAPDGQKPVCSENGSLGSVPAPAPPEKGVTGFTVLRPSHLCLGSRPGTPGEGTDFQSILNILDGEGGLRVMPGHALAPGAERQLGSRALPSPRPLALLPTASAHSA